MTDHRSTWVKSAETIPTPTLTELLPRAWAAPEAPAGKLQGFRFVGERTEQEQGVWVERKD